MTRAFNVCMHALASLQHLHFQFNLYKITLSQMFKHSSGILEFLASVHYGCCQGQQQSVRQEKLADWLARPVNYQLFLHSFTNIIPNANVSGFRSFDTASFQDVIYTLERFLTRGSHTLFLRSFQQFTNFFFFSVIQKNTISRLLLFSQKLKSFFVSSKYDEGSYNTQHSFFSTPYHFYSPMYGERSCDIQFLAETQKFRNQRFSFILFF